MFQFPALAPAEAGDSYRSRVSPFGHPRIKACLPATRGLSQAPASFIAVQRLGIRHTPFYACPPRRQVIHANVDPPVASTTISSRIFKEDRCFAGGGERTRTADLLRAKQVLSQLSYAPNSQGKWWARAGLNSRPRAYQARALTS